VFLRKTVVAFPILPRQSTAHRGGQVTAVIRGPGAFAWQPSVSGPQRGHFHVAVEIQPCQTRHPSPILVIGLYNLYEQYTTMTRLNVSKAREEFPEVLNRAAYGNERTIVSRRGKDLAAVIPIEDLHLLERLAREEMDRVDLEDARAALAEAEEKGTVPLEEARKRLGL